MTEALFDLAVNRAASFRRSAGDSARLEQWHARTRFAVRVPLEAICAALASKPPGDWHWAGGPGGAWQPGRGRTP